MDQQKQRRYTFLQYLVTFSLIALLVRGVNLSEVAEVLRRVDVVIFSAYVLIMVGNKLIGTYRWKELLAALALNINFLYLYKLNLYSIVLNSVFPSTVGGDAYRVVQLVRGRSSGKMAVTIATTLDRILGIIGLLSLAFLTVLFNNYIDPQVAWFFFTASGAGIAASFMLLWGRGSQLIFLMMKIIRNDWINSRLGQLTKIMDIYQNKKSTLLAALALSILFQVTAIYNQYLLFQSIHVNVPFILLLFAIPITGVLTALPISIGGLGVREVSLLGMLAVAGIDSAAIISYSLVGYLSILVLGAVLLGYNILGRSIKSRLCGSSSKEAINAEKEVMYLADE